MTHLSRLSGLWLLEFFLFIVANGGGVRAYSSTSSTDTFLAARNGLFSTPQLVFPFPQHACAELETFPGYTLPSSTSFPAFTRSSTATSCPAWRGSNFPNGITGVSVLTSNDPSALQFAYTPLSLFTSTFSASASAPSSVEVWFSVPAAVSTANTPFVLVELSCTLVSPPVLLQVVYIYDATASFLQVTVTGSNPLLFTLTNLPLFEQELGSTPGIVFVLFVTFQNNAASSPSKGVISAWMGVQYSDTILQCGGASQSTSAAIPSWNTTAHVLAQVPDVNLALRVGSSIKETSTTPRGPITIHLLALHGIALSLAQMQSLVAVGLPLSVPATSTTPVAVIMSQSTPLLLRTKTSSITFSMNQPDVLFELADEGESATAFVLDTLPVNGTFIANVAANGLLEAANASSLIYLPTTPYIFSVASNTASALQKCVSTPFDAFSFRVSNGVCDGFDAPPAFDSTNSVVEQEEMRLDVRIPDCFSVNAATIACCVLDIQDLPYLVNGTIIANDVAPNTSFAFSLSPIDKDDFQVGLADGALSTFRSRGLSGELEAASGVRFLQPVGAYGGRLTLLPCTLDAPTVPTDTVLFASTFPNGITAYPLCYVVNALAPENVNETFMAIFNDISGAPGPISLFQFTTGTALTGCYPVSSTCTLFTSQRGGGGGSSEVEGGTTIPFSGVHDSLSGRTLFLSLLSLPTHGTLLYNGSLLTTITDMFFPCNPEGACLGFSYLPDPFYFNQFSRAPGDSKSVFENALGEGIDGCAYTNTNTKTNTTSCLCAHTTSPGCPDSFSFRVVASAGQGESLTFAHSSPETFWVYVTADIALAASGGLYIAGGGAESNVSSSTLYLPSLSLPGTWSAVTARGDTGWRIRDPANGGFLYTVELVVAAPPNLNTEFFGTSATSQPFIRIIMVGDGEYENSGGTTVLQPLNWCTELALAYGCSNPLLGYGTLDAIQNALDGIQLAGQPGLVDFVTGPLVGSLQITFYVIEPFGTNATNALDPATGLPNGIPVTFTYTIAGSSPDAARIESERVAFIILIVTSASVAATWFFFLLAACYRIRWRRLCREGLYAYIFTNDAIQIEDTLVPVDIERDQTGNWYAVFPSLVSNGDLRIWCANLEHEFRKGNLTMQECVSALYKYRQKRDVVDVEE